MKVGQANNALLQYEAGQELVSMHQMTTTDNKVFKSSDEPWSNKSGCEPKIYPDGVATGGNITPVSTDDDKVAVSEATVYQAGVLRTITAAEIDVTRPGSGSKVVVSIVVNTSGAYEAISGTSTSGDFSETRGAAGGPAFIPVGAIEVGQVRFTGTSAPVANDEIKQIENVHKEMTDRPPFEDFYTKGERVFTSALPAIHTGSVCKNVYCEVYTPIFAPLEPTSDFVPPEETHSLSSTEVYGGAIGSSSSSLNQASFTAYLKDGITDPIVKLKNQDLYFKFFSDRLKTIHLLLFGKLGISRTFPAGGNIQASCTITCSEPAEERTE